MHEGDGIFREMISLRSDQVRLSGGRGCRAGGR